MGYLSSRNSEALLSEAGVFIGLHQALLHWRLDFTVSRREQPNAN